VAGADSTLALQAAIVAALRADGGLSSLVADRIWDRAPQGGAFPFVSLGPELSAPWEGSDLEGWEVEWQVDTWSRGDGAVECRRVMAAVASVLHREPLSVSDHRLVLGSLIAQRTMDDPDGETTHGVQRFRFLTHI
jgi:hypothetical protein